MEPVESVRREAEEKFDVIRRCPHSDLVYSESDQRYWDETKVAVLATCSGCGLFVVVKTDKEATV